MIMNLEIIQERMKKFGAEQLKKELIKIYYIELNLFEDTVDIKKGRSRSSVKKTTAGPFIVPPTPGPLVSI